MLIDDDLRAAPVGARIRMHCPMHPPGEYVLIGPRIVRREPSEDRSPALTFHGYQFRSLADADRLLISDVHQPCWELLDDGLMPEDRVLNAPSGMRNAVVTGDWLPRRQQALAQLDAFIDLDTPHWNGWAIPHIDRATANKLISLLALAHHQAIRTGNDDPVDLMTWDGDTLVLHRVDDGEQERIEPTVDRIGRPLWNVGLGWRWEELHAYTVIGDGDAESTVLAVLPAHVDVTWLATDVWTAQVFAHDETHAAAGALTRREATNPAPDAPATTTD